MTTVFIPGVVTFRCTTMTPVVVPGAIAVALIAATLVIVRGVGIGGGVPGRAA